jgi:hypothetical protein
LDGFIQAPSSKVLPSRDQAGAVLGEGDGATDAGEGFCDQNDWPFHGDCEQQSAGHRVALGERQG